MTNLADYFRDELRACPGGVMFLRDFSTVEDAWNACPHPSWMSWFLYATSAEEWEYVNPLARTFAFRAMREIVVWNDTRPEHTVWDALVKVETLLGAVTLFESAADVTPARERVRIEIRARDIARNFTDDVRESGGWHKHRLASTVRFALTSGRDPSAMYTLGAVSGEIARFASEESLLSRDDVRGREAARVPVNAAMADLWREIIPIEFIRTRIKELT